ncbi:MAG: ArgE/DapE family deacylase [Syntrophaceae bacterium]|nr:ArgE/DapE family deacylase [Syntrophaceae bacterium]
METRIDVKIRVALETAVDRLRDEMVHILTDLVSIPSVVGSEGSAQDFMRRQYESIGLEVQTFEANKEKVRAHPAFVDSEIPFEGRPNVIGILRGDPRKKSIILNGHIDVVSPEPSDQWQYDPWGGEIEGNRLYGRGAMDMKAGLVTNLYAVKALASLGLKPGGTVMLQSVIEEEAGGGGGTLACLMEGYTADGMIITEPHLFPVISHAGILYFRVKVKGKTAHAGRAHVGVNAIGKMLKIYQALEVLDAQRAAELKFPLYEKVDGRSCHLNIGILKAGDWPSTVAGFAEMESRISFIPGENMTKVKQIVEDVIHVTAQNDPWLQDHPPVVEWFGWQTDPWYQDPENVFIKTVIRNIESVCQQKMELFGSPAGLDTRFSAYFGFPAITFGPDGDNEHGTDEYVDLDTLPLVTTAIALTTLDWCSKAKTV